MPIYEFHCEKCESEFETLVFAGSATAPCPRCGSEEVRRLMSMFSSKSGDKYKSSAGGGADCSGCTSKNCGSCG